MFRKIFLYISCFFATQSVVAQDIHFSNFYTNTLNVNPANSGNFIGQYRFCLAYRDQYRTVAQPYQTFTANFDGKYTKRYRKDFMGYGLLFNFVIAGGANYNMVQIGVPITYLFPLASGKIIFSAGIQPSLGYNSIDYSSLAFQEQFDGIQYNPDIEVSENFETNSVLYFDLNAGALAIFKASKKQSYTFGVALFNINRPSISFFDDEEVSLKSRAMLHGSANLSVLSDFDIIPGFKIQFQGKQHEFHFGGMCVKYFDKSAISRIQSGIWYRSKNNDAIILGLGCNYQQFDIMLDYDINISSLKTASNTHGAFEITMSWIVEKNDRNKRMTAIRCPHTL